MRGTGGAPTRRQSRHTKARTGRDRDSDSDAGENAAIGAMLGSFFVESDVQAGEVIEGHGSVQRCIGSSAASGEKRLETFYAEARRLEGRREFHQKLSYRRAAGIVINNPLRLSPHFTDRLY